MNGHKNQSLGFTLVEIMIAVTIVGLLCMLAMPAWQRAKWTSANARFASDARTAATAFEMFALENGQYPPDMGPGGIPPGMLPYLAKFRWNEPTSLGGQWDWDYNAGGVVAAVTATGHDASLDQLRELDKRLDDDNLATGVFRQQPWGYGYVMEN